MPGEPFVAGVDPRLRQWLKMRSDAREAQLRAGNVACVTSDIKYKLNRYWTEKLMEGTSNLSSSSAVYHKAGDHSWEDEIEVFSIQTFLVMIEAIPIVPVEEIALRVFRKRNLEYLKIYHERGLNMNVRLGSLRRNMLHMACWDGEYDKVCFLLKHGVHLNAIDDHGSTPLHLAIQTPSQYHSLSIIRILLKHGCRVNAKDRRGQTALHLACIIKSKDIIEILLQNNANPYSLDTHDKLPIDHTKNVMYALICNYGDRIIS